MLCVLQCSFVVFLSFSHPQNRILSFHWKTEVALYLLLWGDVYNIFLQKQRNAEQYVVWFHYDKDKNVHMYLCFLTPPHQLPSWN